MFRFKFSFAYAAILILAALFSSCNKEVEKEKSENNFSNSQMQERDDSPSLFGDNHIVPADLAKKLAEKVNLTVSEVMRVGSSTSTRPVDSLFTVIDSLGIPLLYIVNYADDGFIIISADDRYDPICALAEHGKYETAAVPSMLLEWLEITLENVLSLKYGSGISTNYAGEKWAKIVDEIGEEESLIDENCCPDCPNYPRCLTYPRIGCGAPNIDCDGGGGGDPCAPYTTTTKGPLLATR